MTVNHCNIFSSTACSTARSSATSATVSYTHLDVYKRQPFSSSPALSVRCPARALRAFSGQRRGSACRPGSSAGLRRLSAGHKRGQARFSQRKRPSSGLSLIHIWGIHANCRTALQRAVQEGLIRTNPAVGCKLPVSYTHLCGHRTIRNTMIKNWRLRYVKALFRLR